MAFAEHKISFQRLLAMLTIALFATVSILQTP